jgi:oligopeptide/dipeptide ABC transporter ATP-binding protein
LLDAGTFNIGGDNMDEVLLKGRNLKKYFYDTGKGIKKKRNIVRAVDGVNFDIFRKETFALVGESGCGKSTLGRLMINLLKPTEGEVLYRNNSIYKFTNKEDRSFRKKVQIIFQDPYASLNPRMKIGDIIGEPLKIHGVVDRKERQERVIELMNLVGLRKDYMRRYPHQFSGGQRQRIGIARALALNPELIICDEPVSALDVSIQSQILNLLKSLQKKFGLTYLFISHDLSVVKYISHRVCVMFLGKIVEIGSCEELFEHPLHPYTKFLLGAVPLPDPKLRDREKLILEGDIPSPINPPNGCRFHTRCPFARDICSNEEPKLRSLENRRFACHFPCEHL